MCGVVTVAQDRGRRMRCSCGVLIRVASVTGGSGVPQRSGGSVCGFGDRLFKLRCALKRGNGSRPVPC